MNHAPATKKLNLSLTQQILLAIITGLVLGTGLNFIPHPVGIDTYFINGAMAIGGKIFISLMKMLVVPIVLVSLICGVSQLHGSHKLGILGLKTMAFYMFTTVVAISLGLAIATLFHVGAGSNLQLPASIDISSPPPLTDVITNIFPDNPFKAFVDSNMLQIIVFALFFGTAIKISGRAGEIVGNFFQSLNTVVMEMITMLMKIAPIGVFCLVTKMFAEVGLSLLETLGSYFFTVIFVLVLHVTVTNSILLRVIGKLNPIMFFRKMYSAMMFAFSTSSSNASIPIVLSTVEHRLGVKNAIAAFVIPLGATINMDGTAIMQGIATVFIANLYNIDLAFSQYIMVIIAATLASIGTAGVPSVGLITLAMVLQQVDIPIEGIMLIIGIDRLLDMVRTAVNVTGDATITCVIAKTEQSLNLERFNDTSATLIEKINEDLIDPRLTHNSNDH